MKDAIKVVRATLDVAYVDQLAWVIAGAFHDLPQSRWLVPDEEERHEILPLWFALDIEWAMRYGGAVFTTTDELGVAVFMPPPGMESEGLGEPTIDYDARVAAIVGPRHQRRFKAFDATLRKHHPTEQPHDWLALLAVRAEHRNRGIGTALMAEQADLPIYLEAADIPSRRVYQRRGFHDLGEPFRLPESGPPMYPMWRDPRETDTTL